MKVFSFNHILSILSFLDAVEHATLPLAQVMHCLVQI